MAGRCLTLGLLAARPRFLHGVQIDLDAARLLGERTEGNLLAADQELQKLA